MVRGVIRIIEGFENISYIPLHMFCGLYMENTHGLFVHVYNLMLRYGIG